MKLWGLTFKLVSRNINDIIDLPPNNIDLFNGDLGKYLHILNPISYSLSLLSFPTFFILPFYNGSEEAVLSHTKYNKYWVNYLEV